MEYHSLEVEGEQGARTEFTGNEVLIRVIAAFLGLIGAFFGFVLLVIFHSEGDPLRVLSFALITGPGYLVTAGYFWRVATRMSYPWRAAIWIASILVQGLWFLIFLCEGRPNGFMLWWFVACVVSAVALLMESDEQRATL